MSNSNLQGTGRATGDQMAAYDKLPPDARHALAGCVFDWAATTTLARLRSRRLSGREAAKMVKGWDITQHKADVKRGLVISQTAAIKRAAR